MDPRRKRKLVLAGVFAAPLVVGLGASRLSLPAGPTPTLASHAPPPVATATPKRPTDEERAARAHAERIDPASIERVPLYYPPERRDTPPPETDAPEQAPPEPTRGEWVLTSVFRAGDGREYAVIDDQLRTVGDELVGGWVLESVDPRGRTAVIRDPDGKTTTLRLFGQ